MYLSDYERKYKEFSKTFNVVLSKLKLNPSSHTVEYDNYNSVFLMCVPFITEMPILAKINLLKPSRLFWRNGFIEAQHNYQNRIAVFAVFRLKIVHEYRLSGWLVWSLPPSLPLTLVHGNKFQYVEGTTSTCESGFTSHFLLVYSLTHILCFVM